MASDARGRHIAQRVSGHQEPIEDGAGGSENLGNIWLRQRHDRSGTFVGEAIRALMQIVALQILYFSHGFQMTLPDIPDLSTRQIQAVLAVAEYRSFIAAAANMRISQPALTRTVQRIEDGLGIALFNRTTRSVEITQAGREFSAMAERILTALKLSSRSLRELIDEKRGQVILSSIMSIANGRLPAVIAAYRKSRPAIEIYVREGVHGQALEEVRGGSVDFGFSYIDDLPSGLKAEPLGEAYFYLALPEDHPLTKLKQVALTGLVGVPMVGLPHNAQTRRIIDGTAAIQQISLTYSVTVTQLSTMMELVSQGVGTAIVPFGATIGRGRDDGIVYRPIHNPCIRRRFGIIMLGERTPSPTAQGLLEVIRSFWLHDEGWHDQSK